MYACFGAHIERGGRPYWLLHSKSVAYAAPAGLKTSDGSTIRKGTWIVDAHWYTCTSDSQDRRTYHREESELVHVIVKSLIQETSLEFRRATLHDCYLPDEAHLLITRFTTLVLW